MSFTQNLPEWKAEGIAPSETQKQTGFQPGMKPPAQWFNWVFNWTYLALKELQEKAAEKSIVDFAMEGIQSEIVQNQEYAKEEFSKLFGRLDTPERSAITFQPGIQVVQADQDAAFKLAGLQGRTVLNYQSQIGIFGVKNPYAIRYGANLLPPLYEWTKTGHTSNDTDSYGLMGTLVSSAIGSDAFASCNIDVIGNQDYTLSNPVSSTGFMRISTYNSVGTRIQGIFVKPGESKTIKMAVTAVRLSVVLSGVTAYTDEFDSTKWTWQAGTSRIFTNPMLVIGNIAKPFKPREDAMLALQTELHANPDTGANPDIVFERDGQYFKLAKWRKVVLEGSIAFVPFGSASGLKVVNAILPGAPAVDGSGVLTKYQGKVIKETDYATVNSSPDNLNIGSSGANGVFDNFQISIANAESGWGDSYTPTADEIKAYFMGWRMYDGTASGTPYNGSGAKYWHKLSDGTTTPGTGTTTLPTTQAPNWTPYQLLYQLATPTVEPITSEGQLTFIEGDNQIEVGTGIVLREKAKPTTVGLNYLINHVEAPAGLLRYKTNRILGVYKNNQLTDAVKTINSASGQGGAFAYITPAQFDPSAAYTVTYLMLDKYPAADFTGTYAENEKALLLDAIKSIQEHTTRISVLESKKAEKDSPSWIAPTLLNGWTNHDVTLSQIAYLKDSSGYVHIKGVAKPGAINTSVFQLPVGYRPSRIIVAGVAANKDGGHDVLGRVNIGSNGNVSILALSDATITNTGWVSLDNLPPFLAEQ